MQGGVSTKYAIRSDVEEAHSQYRLPLDSSEYDYDSDPMPPLTQAGHHTSPANKPPPAGAPPTPSPGRGMTVSAGYEHFYSARDV